MGPDFLSMALRIERPVEFHKEPSSVRCNFPQLHIRSVLKYLGVMIDQKLVKYGWPKAKLPAPYIESCLVDFILWNFGLGLCFCEKIT